LPTSGRESPVLRDSTAPGFARFAGSFMGRDGLEPSTLGLKVPCSTN
jgi:hypothetical protein